ncbi:hypothetical protein LMG22465_07140 [Lactobacillus helveticus]|nr:hypothetical protein LMG22465_07140 [Lactobacillus helveticus]
MFRSNSNMGKRENVRCRFTGDLYMIKKNEYYIFFSKSNSSLCILNGGAKKSKP